MRLTVEREIKYTPAWVNERAAQAGGFHITGQPWFRVVWGWSRLTVIGGWWEDYNDAGQFVRRVFEYRRVPKYYPLDRWHIEKLVPASFFKSPAHWESYTREEEDGVIYQALGPFPSRGEYEHCFTLYDPKYPPGDRRSYLELNPETVGYICAAIQRSRYLIEQDGMGAIWRREAQKERDWDSKADALLNDDNVFASKPHIYVPDLRDAQKYGVRSA